ncbi:MAG: amphi-Trp domain-containing protein [Nitrospinae bacterium CG22_combo_CG10-13_8_21_14_all_47_10]|jgi:amphi-Trp domain-containing protein|nr:MAG: amphi-Trp domain-containing protein [Nitrospinae bacterium CG22_combo_CG10-13_8_21_14_all_47_10]
MAVSDDEFKHESIQDTELIIKYLKALTEGFQSGKLIFGTKQKKFILEPNGLLRLGISAKRKDRKVKVSLKASWTEGKEGKELYPDPLEIKAGK